MKAANVRSERAQRDDGASTADVGEVEPAGIKAFAHERETATAVGPRLGVADELDESSPCAAADPAVPPGALSVRALNVLKELAEQLTGEIPPQGQWVPPDHLLQLLAFQHLATARNCGPVTTTEIVEWARARGKIIRPAFHAGKSLSAMWQDAIAKFPTGEISNSEVMEALERSTRRKNTRIPLAFQNIILQILDRSRK